MHTLPELLKFRDSLPFRAVVNRITDKITAIPWQVTPDNEPVKYAINYPNPEMGYVSFIRRTLLDMLALNFATFEVAVTEQKQFVLMQCFPAELFAVKGWTKDCSKEEYRWVYHNKQTGTDVYLSDQKIAIFPSYGNFDLTYEEMWGLPSPGNQILEAIALKLDLKSQTQALPKMDFTQIFDASLSLQCALEEIPDPAPGYASIWQHQFGKTVTKLKSGIIVPNDPAILLGQSDVQIQGYSEWVLGSILTVLLHIYPPLLQRPLYDKKQVEQVRQALGNCGGYEDILVAIALIIAQGINRLMRNLDIDCEFSFLGVSPSERKELAELEMRQTMAHLGYTQEEEEHGESD